MKPSAIAAGMLLALLAGGAQAELYPYQIPKTYPALAALWKRSLPAPLRTVDWLADLQGVSVPMTVVRVGGRPMTAANVCKPHFCNSDSLWLLIAPDRARVVGRVQWSQWDPKGAAPVPTIMLVGDLKPGEADCLRALAGDSKVTTC